MKKLFCILITWSALTQIAQAEDIELYVKHNVSTREQPRVLMLFDTSGSMAWDSQNGKACYERYSYRVWTGWRYETRYGYRETECFNGSNCYQANEYNQAVQAVLIAASKLRKTRCVNW